MLPKKHRAPLAVMLALLAIFLVAACGNSSEDASTSPAGTSATTSASEDSSGSGETAASDDVAVTLKGWVTPPLTKEYKLLYLTATPLNTYVQAMEFGARNAAEQLGVELEVVYNEWDAQEQLSQIQNAIANKDEYDGIVSGVADPNVLCDALSKEAPQAGLPVVIVNFPICGSEDYTEGTVGLSTSQSIHFYRNYVDWAFSSLPEGGKVGVITGPAEEGHTIEMKKAIDELKGNYPNIEITQIVSGPFTAESGLQEANTVLQRDSDLAMIISTYDQNTLGAVQALQAAGKQPGEVKLFNLGGEKVIRPLMAEGWIEGTMYLDPVNEIGQGVEMMVAHLEGKEYPQFNDLSQGEVKMTKENMDQFPETF